MITYLFLCRECGARFEALGREAADNHPEAHKAGCEGKTERDWKGEAANVNVSNLR